MATSNQSMFEVMEALNKRMCQFESDLQNSTPSSTNETLAADFFTFKEFTMGVFRAFQQQLGALTHNFDVQEMRARRKFLLIHGVPQPNKQEDSAATVTKTIIDLLKITDFNADHISRSHRMGRAMQDKPRPLLVKFRDLAVRDKVWFAKTNLRGTGITISEFLTKPRHDTFMAARQLFGVNKCWTRDGHIHILGPNGIRHRVCSMGELQKICPPTSVTTKLVAVSATNVVKEPAAPVNTRRAAAKASKK